MRNKINLDNFIIMFLDGSSGIDHVNSGMAEMFNKY